MAGAVGRWWGRAEVDAWEVNVADMAGDSKGIMRESGRAVSFWCGLSGEIKFMSCLLPVWVGGGREVSVPGTRPFVSASAVVAVEWTVICLLVSVCLSQFLRKGRERAWHGAWCSFSKKNTKNCILKVF
jgi:hypothetical protein